MKNVIEVSTKPFLDQNPGTSGLRKRTEVFMQNNYVENYVQSFFNITNIKGKSFIIGGDGRYFNKVALNKIISIAIANEVGKILIAKNNYLSTPAGSIIIRKYKLDYGVILSASHNIGGINGDFGIKINLSNGAPAGVMITDKIFKETLQISQYKVLEDFNIDIERVSSYKINNTEIEIIDTVKEYTERMTEIFDFSKISSYIASTNFNFMFNALNGITGPYAYDIFHKKLGLDISSLLNISPMEDFGGLVPDPNPVMAKDYINFVKGKGTINFAAACDADGDRNMLFTPENNIEPSDSLAIMLQFVEGIPYYTGKVYGVARSLATSPAVDKIAKEKGINLYEVPIGWKYFSNLLDAHKITLCGEESFGTGSNHSREKDGIWSILFWLNIIANEKVSPNELLQNMWQEYGRYYSVRYDFENLEIERAKNIIDKLWDNSSKNIGKKIHNKYELNDVINFSYRDLIDNTKIENQGIVLVFNNTRIVIRQSGTGTVGATIRIYISKLENSSDKLNLNKIEYLKDLINIFYQLIEEELEANFIV